MEKENLDDFSSSYFYYIAKIYENGWGLKTDLLISYCYYNRASTACHKNLGSGTIISYFRRFKSLKKLKQINILAVANELDSYKINEMYKDEDDKLCYICYENNKDIIFIPCKHMVCKKCSIEFQSNHKCPTC